MKVKFTYRTNGIILNEFDYCCDEMKDSSLPDSINYREKRVYFMDNYGEELAKIYYCPFCGKEIEVKEVI